MTSLFEPSIPQLTAQWVMLIDQLFFDDDLRRDHSCDCKRCGPPWPALALPPVLPLVSRVMPKADASAHPASSKTCNAPKAAHDPYDSLRCPQADSANSRSNDPSPS